MEKSIFAFKLFVQRATILSRKRTKFVACCGKVLLFRRLIKQRHCGHGNWKILTSFVSVNQVSLLCLLKEKGCMVSPGPLYKDSHLISGH